MYNPNDPYAMFRQIPRLQKRRGRPQTLRGGGIGGQMGGINRQVSRGGGGGGQLYGAQPQVQRGVGGNKLMGGSRTTTGPGQPQPEQQGLLGGLLQAKGAYEGVQDAAKGGKNIRQAYNNFNFEDFKQQTGDSFDRGIASLTGETVSDANRTRQLEGLTGFKGDPSGRAEIKYGDFMLDEGGEFGNTLQPNTVPMPGADPSALSGLNQHAGVQRAPQFINGTPVPAGVVPPTAPVSNLSGGLLSSAQPVASQAASQAANQAANQAIQGAATAGEVASKTASATVGASAKMSSEAAKQASAAAAKTASSTGVKALGKAAGQAAPYIGIAMDVADGSIGGVTGSGVGDVALRGSLAYATGGLSEIGFMFF